MVIDLVRRQFDAGGWKLPGEGNDATYLSLERLLPTDPRHISPTRAVRRLRRSRRPVLKTHSAAGLAAWRGELAPWRSWLIERADFVYCYRDGREVMCSMHLWRKGFDSAARVPLSEFIRQPRADAVTGAPAVSSRVQAWGIHVAEWLATPGVIGLDYREVLSEPRRVLTRLGDAFRQTPRLVEPLVPTPFTSSLQSRWSRLASIRPRATTMRGRPRGEMLEEWRQAFDRDDRRYFHDQAGEALLRFGFESSPEWWRDER